MARRHSHVQTRTDRRRGGVLQRARHRPEILKNANGGTRRSGGENGSGEEESRRRGRKVQRGAGISAGATRAAARVFRPEFRFRARNKEDKLVPTSVDADAKHGENGCRRRRPGESHDDGREERYGEARRRGHVFGRSGEFGRVTVRAPNATTQRATQSISPTSI